uniref:Putative bacteriohemerythrin n=1 Tax=Magnetococcus massalia (strain MO-1) TaxID=451514 RepID=A0A1S7LFG6_MAGMO|nr:Putative bacteriohemerythrin [Candidatus Magnetococcus massalia]
MEWQSDYEVGVEILDTQHQEFFRRLDSLSQAIFKDAEETRAAMDFFSLYVEEHLSTEEALMEKHGFSNRAAHIKLHHQFRDDVVAFREYFSSDDYSPGLAVNMLNYLGEWFQEHILKVDRVLGEFLQGVE